MTNSSWVPGPTFHTLNTPRINDTFHSHLYTIAHNSPNELTTLLSKKVTTLDDTPEAFSRAGAHESRLWSSYTAPDLTRQGGVSFTAGPSSEARWKRMYRCPLECGRGVHFHGCLLEGRRGVHFQDVPIFCPTIDISDLTLLNHLTWKIKRILNLLNTPFIFSQKSKGCQNGLEHWKEETRYYK